MKKVLSNKSSARKKGINDNSLSSGTLGKFPQAIAIAGSGLQNSGEFLYIYNLKLKKIQFFSNGFGKSLGYNLPDANTAEKQCIKMLYQPKNPVSTVKIIKPNFKNLKDGDYFEREFQITRKSGESIMFRSKEYILSRTTDGSPEQILGLIRPVAEIKQSVDEVSIVAEVSQFLNLADNPSEVYNYICSKLYEILDNSIIFLTILDNDSQIAKLAAFKGPDQALETANEILGFDLLKRNFPITDLSPQEFDIYRSGRLEIMEDGIYKLLMQKVSKELCELVSEALHMTHAYAIGFAHKNKEFGGIVILTDSPEEIARKTPIVETIISLTSAILYRMRSDRVLRENEKKFRTLANNLPDIVSRFDTELRIIYINRGIERLIEKRSETIIGKNLSEFLLPHENVYFLNKKLEDTFHTGEASKYEFEILINSERRYFSSRIVPEFDDKGEVLSVLFVARDITERKLAEETMRESENRYYRMVQILPDGVIIHTDGISVYANETARKIMHAETTEQMLGRSVMDFVHPDYRELVSLRIKSSLLNQTKLESREECFITFDGKEIQVSVTASPFNYQGKPSMMTVFTDITDRIKVVEALRESEKRYRNMVQIIPDGIIIHSNDKSVFANEAAKRILHAKNINQLVNINVLDLVQPEFRAKELERMQWSYKEQSTNEHLEENFLALDGTIIPVSARSTPFIYMGQSSMLTIFTDITERKKAEKELKSNINLLHNIIDSSNDAIYVKDLSHRIILYNQAYSNSLETQIEELQLSKPGNSNLDPGLSNSDKADLYELFNAEDQAVLEGEIIHITNEQFQIDNEVHYFDTLKLPLRDNDGIIIGMFGISRDISERQKAEEEINLLNRELENRVAERTSQLTASNKELESFAYSISHDLRAPLRAIDGFSQLLLESYSPVLDEEGRHYLDRIRNGAQNMSKLIDALLNLSRISRIQMNIQSVNLSKIVEDIILDLNENDPSRKVDTSVKPALTCLGDLVLLKTALENLLTNAWKFTSKRESARIEFGSFEKEDKTVFFVRDDGAGFDMTYVDKLFGPFQRLHTPSEFPGTGIGLATVQRIIQKHGGKIWAEGQPENGATFFFSLSQTFQ